MWCTATPCASTVREHELPTLTTFALVGSVPMGAVPFSIAAEKHPSKHNIQQIPWDELAVCSSTLKKKSFDTEHYQVVVDWTSVQLGCFPHAQRKMSSPVLHVAGVLKKYVLGGPFGTLRRWRTSPGAFLTMGTCAGAARIFL